MINTPWKPAAQRALDRLHGYHGRPPPARAEIDIERGRAAPREARPTRRGNANLTTQVVPAFSRNLLLCRNRECQHPYHSGRPATAGALQ